MAEKYQKIPEHPRLSPAYQTIQKSLPSSKKLIKELEDAGAPENQWGEPGAIQGVLLRGSWHIKCSLPDTSCWEKGNLWDLSPASFFLSSFLWGQISCTRKIPCTKLHETAVPPLQNIILPNAINRHLMSSPNSFKCSNFKSLKTIKYSLRLRVGYVRLHPNSVPCIRAEQRWCIRLDYATCQESLSELVGISQVYWSDSQSMPCLFCLDMIGLPRLITAPRSLYFEGNRLIAAWSQDVKCQYCWEMGCGWV